MLYIKGKVVPVLKQHALMVYNGSEGKAPHSVNLNTGWRWSPCA